MNDNTFGSFLRFLRKSRQPQITQEMLAEAIGRKKMTISQFEQGKNAPPQGELLDNIIKALCLSVEEENKLRFLASQSRKSIPRDIEDYFFSNPSIYKTIRIAKQNAKNDSDWKRIAEDME